MSATYAGAVAAMRAKFEAEWITAPATPRSRITYANEKPAAPWPPKQSDGRLAGWVLFEVIAAPTSKAYPGTPGKRMVVTDGHIYVTAYVPIGAGADAAIALAEAGGEIFREKTFYTDEDAGCYVRTWTPGLGRVEDGDDEGQWFRFTAAIPFSFWTFA